MGLGSANAQLQPWWWIMILKNKSSHLKIHCWVIYFLKYCKEKINPFLLTIHRFPWSTPSDPNYTEQHTFSSYIHWETHTCDLKNCDVNNACLCSGRRDGEDVDVVAGEGATEESLTAVTSPNFVVLNLRQVIL